MSSTKENVYSLKMSLREARADMRKTSPKQLAELRRQASDPNDPMYNAARDLLAIMEMTDEQIDKVGR